MGFGWIADRVGRAHTFTAAVVLFAAAKLAASRSDTWPVLVVCRMVTGIGIGGTMVVSAILVAEAWHERARAIAMGFLGVSFPIGIISAGAVSYRVADWRAGFLTGLLPLALGIVSILVVRDSAHWLASREERHRTGGASPFRTLLSPANRRNFALGATIFGTMSIGLWATFSWLPSWAQDLGGSGDGAQHQRGTRSARPRARRLRQRHCGLLRDVPARLPGDVVRPGDPRRVVDTLSPSASAVNCFQRGSGG